jgi:hypothetical protein
MPREHFEIWEEPGTPFPWKAQLINYVGSFPTQGAAERFVAAVKHHQSDKTPKTPKKDKK